MYRLISGALTCLVLAGCGGGDSSDNQFSGRTTSESLVPETVLPVTPSPEENTEGETLGLPMLCPVNMTCDFMQAPKDYDNPNGELVNIFYAVHKAQDPARRLGALFLNFGGPSAPAAGGAAYMAEYNFPQEILDQFDIVGMDPRGAGQSAFAEELTNCAVAEYHGQGNCDATFQQVAPYIGSNTVVKDMDRLREVLGDEQLTFLGYSYGTRLGSLYANMFPERVRAIVLDSSMSPTDANNVEIRVGNTAGYEKIAAYRLDYTTYPARKTAYEDLAQNLFTDTGVGYRANTSYVHVANDGGQLSFDALTAVMNLTTTRDSSDYWSKVDTELKELLDRGNGDDLYWKLLFSSTWSNTTYSSQDDDLRGNAHFKAVICTDERVPLTDVEIALSGHDYYDASALYGPLTYWQTASLCQGWSAKRDPIAPVENMASKLGGKQILLIGGQYDPATPYTWTEEMVSALGESASLITVNNRVDHAFSYKNVSCIDDPTTQYLIDPTQKVTGAACEWNPGFFTKGFDGGSRVPHPTDNIIGW